MHSLGFPFVMFFIAMMAERLLAESEFVPLISSDTSLSPVPITPDINPNWYDSGNMFPVDINPVASTQTEILPLDSEIAQEPSNDQAESSMEAATVDIDPDHSPSLCNLASMTTGRKLRREQGKQCVPNFTPHNPLVGGDQPKKGTDQGGKPGRQLTEDEMIWIYEDDLNWLNNDRIHPHDPYWASPEAEPCKLRNPQRPVSLCCMGPSKVRTGLQKRAPTIIDMNNCNVYLVPRPWCTDPLLREYGHYCCFKIDFGKPTFKGYLGRDCVPMLPSWYYWLFDGISPAGLGGGAAVP